jgi:NDP-sugar pyrophosphorylase family protein
MKTLLICPGNREAVAPLAEACPLSNVPILGKTLIEYWLEHLAQCGATHVCILATDRPQQVRTLVGDGARWGLHVEVLPEVRELAVAEARAKFISRDESAWLPAPDDVHLMDHLPELPERPLFTSYACWFAALQAWMPHAATPDRIGVRQIRPGVWAGLHTQISPDAELHAPSWIGENVHIGPGAVIGPWSVLETGAYVEGEAEIAGSMIGPATFVGKLTEVRHSIAWGSTLVNWKLDSCIKVADAFLLCGRGQYRSQFQHGALLGRIAAAWVITLTLPLALFAALKTALQGRRVLRPQLAVRPQPVGSLPMAGDTLIYYQFTGVPGWLRRWPQLFNIMCGDFAWIGNRPLSPREAARLDNDFERLWLAAPLGLVSLADTEVGRAFFDDEARAHASYYAARANWRLDVTIFARAVFLFVFGFPYSRAREHFARLFHAAPANRQEAH